MIQTNLSASLHQAINSVAPTIKKPPVKRQFVKRFITLFCKVWLKYKRTFLQIIRSQVGKEVEETKSIFKNKNWDNKEFEKMEVPLSMSK